MNYIFLSLNKYRQNPHATFLAVCFLLVIIGFALLERNACRITEYIYTSNRLAQENLPFACRIF